MRGCKVYVLGLILILILMPASISQAIPHLMNYQGRLTDGSGGPITTTTLVEFRIWDMSVGGTTLWMESQSVTPDGDGVYSVLLGSLSSIPDSALAGSEAYLGVRIDSDPELTPRARLVAVAYAYRVETVDGAKGGIVSNDLVVTGRGTFGPGQTNSGVGSFAAGMNNTVTGSYSVVSGGDSNQASGTRSTISGGGGNQALEGGATVGGGEFNHSKHFWATVCGGYMNSANRQYSTVAGGSENNAYGDWGTVSGGHLNFTDIGKATVGGGEQNTANATASTVAGGQFNAAGGEYSSISGGQGNSAAGHWSSIPGGGQNSAAGAYAFAAGHLAEAGHNGSFVWADNAGSAFASTGENQFLIRASGGVGIGTNDPLGAALAVNGTICYTGNLQLCSDARYKTDVKTIPDALNRVTQMRGVNFKWKTEEYPDRNFSEGRQVGFVAQELRDIAPEVVMEDAEGYLSVDYGRLTPVLVEAIKSQQSQINELKELVARLAAQSGNEGSTYSVK